MTNLTGRGHASKSQLALEVLENRLTPALSVLSAGGALGHLSMLRVPTHAIESQLGVVGAALESQISDTSQTVSIDATSLTGLVEEGARAAVSSVEPLATNVGVANTAIRLMPTTGVVPTNIADVVPATKVVASIVSGDSSPLGGRALAGDIPSLLTSAKAFAPQRAEITPTLPLAGNVLPIPVSAMSPPESLTASATGINASPGGQSWIDDSRVWQGGFDGSSEVAATAPGLTYYQAAQTDTAANVRDDNSAAGMSDEPALEPEALPMTAALVVNRLEASVTEAAKKLADTLNAEFGWLGTIHPSVWLMCAVFVFMSHEYWTRRRAKGLWPNAGTPWSTGLADVVPVR